jgi:hypothetical protein
VGDEGWWDGGLWTDEVRRSAEADGAAWLPERSTSHAPPDGFRRTEETPGTGKGELRTSGFPVRIDAVVGEQLSVVPSLRKPGIHCQVLALQGRVGSISVFGREMARLASAHGAWFLKKSRRCAGGFTIESVDHEPAGRYLRRPWSPGGTIRLMDGTEVELRRSLPGRWKLRSADGSQCLAEVHRSVVPSAPRHELKLTIHSLPADVDRASPIILAACALLILSPETC